MKLARFSFCLSLLVTCVWLIVFAAVAAAQQTSVTDGKTPTGLTPGAPAGSYPLSGFENVNLYNGNLSFRLPLLNIGGRGSAGFTMTLPIEQKWIVKSGQPHGEIKNLSASPNWWTGKKPGYGPGVLQGRRTGAGEYPGSTYCGSVPIVHEFTLTRLTFTGADGTEYELRDQLTNGEPRPVQGVPCDKTGGSRGKLFVTADGSAASFISDDIIYDHKELFMLLEDRVFFPSGYLLLKDGTRYRIESGEVRWIRDRNGNQISFGAYMTDTLHQTITDSLNRIVTVTPAHSGVSYDEISYAGFGGANRTIKVWYDTLAHRLREDFPSTLSGYELFGLNPNDTTIFDRGRVSRVELPNDGQTPGQSYEFYYNPYGELARVVLPTGGAFEYDWAGSADYDNESIFRYVTVRRVYAVPGSYAVAGGTPENETEYNRDDGSIIDVKTRNAAGTLLGRSLHYFFSDAQSSLERKAGDAISYSPWREGREYKIETFEVVNGVAASTPKQITENTWEQPVAGSTWPLTTAETSTDAKPNDPQITQTVTRLADTNQVSKQTFRYDRYSNRTDVYEYDYGTASAPNYALRHTHVDYLTANVINGVTYNYDTVKVNPSNEPDAALTIHIRSLVSGQQVYAVNSDTGVETLQAESQVKYDEPADPAIDSYGTVTGWSSPATPARGMPTTTSRRVDATEPSGTWLSSRANYDQCGSVRKTWDALGHLSEVEYSGSYHFAYPTLTRTPVPDPTGQYGSTTTLVSTSVYDFSTGLVTSTIDPNNISTTFVYDELNRPKQAVRAGGGLQSQVTIDYNDVTRVITTTSDQAAYNDNLLKSDTRYDGLGRTIETRQYESSTNYIASKQEYDSLGRAHLVSNPFRPGETPIWTTTGFDGLGRVHTVTTPDGAVVTTDYSGNTVKVTDQAGRQRRSVSDALGRLIRVDEPGDPKVSTSLGSTSDPAQPTSYEYDALGNLTKVLQGAQTRTFTYDSMSRLRSALNPESDTISYNYDANGNLRTRTDARGVVATYDYDALNRNISVIYTNDPANTPTVTRTYDSATNGRGRLYQTLTAGTTGTKTTITSYDALGRPQSLSQQFKVAAIPFWSRIYTVQRAYDLAGHVISLTYPSGHSVNYNYDVAGRLADKVPQSQTPQDLAFSGNLGDGVTRFYSSAIIYDASSRMNEEKYGTLTPLYHKRRFNDRGQMWDIRLSTVPSATNPANGDRGAVVNYYSNNFVQGGSGPDNNGNLLRQEIVVPNSGLFQDNFAYDSLNRLTAIEEKLNGTGNNTFKQAFIYDRWGNRRIDTDPSQTYGGVNNKAFVVDTNSNRLYAANDPSHSLIDYDAAGNQQNDGYTSFGSTNGGVTRSYDAENRLLSVLNTPNSTTSTYTYDGDGRRVRRKLAGVETWQIYGLDGELLAEYSANALGAVFVPQKEYGYRDGQLLVTAANGDEQRIRNFVMNFITRFGVAGFYPSLLQDVNALNAAGGQGQAQLLTEARNRAQTIIMWSSIPSDTDYVTALYLTYWQRFPDTVGLAQWVAQVQSIGRNGVRDHFANSPEFADRVSNLRGFSLSDSERTSAFVQYLYNAILHRWASSSEASAAISYFENAEATGQANLVAQAKNWARGLFNSTEYTSRSGLTPHDFVYDLCQAFYGGAPDNISGSDWEYWTDQTGSNWENKQAVMDHFINAGPYDQKAATLYREFLWLVPDQLGTPRITVERTGSLVGIRRHDYLPFGEDLTVGRSTTPGYSTADNVRQKFTSKERDNETGLDYFLARYYTSIQGRFTSPDEFRGGPDELYYFVADAASNPTFYADLGNPQSLNKYQYSYNNPLRYVDPDGHEPDPQDPCKCTLTPQQADAAVSEAQRAVDAVADATGLTAAAEAISTSTKDSKKRTEQAIVATGVVVVVIVHALTPNTQVDPNAIPALYTPPLVGPLPPPPATAYHKPKAQSTGKNPDHPKDTERPGRGNTKDRTSPDWKPRQRPPNWPKGKPWPPWKNPRPEGWPKYEPWPPIPKP